MTYYLPRSTSQRKYYNGYLPQTAQASGSSSSHLYPLLSSNTPIRDPQYNSRRAYLPHAQKRTYRSHSPLPRPPIGPPPSSSLPLPTPPRLLPRAQTHPCVNLYAYGNSTPHRSKVRGSQGNPEQKNRERPFKTSAHEVETRREAELKNKLECDLEKEKNQIIEDEQSGIVTARLIDGR